MIYRHRSFFTDELAPVDFEILDTAGQVGNLNTTFIGINLIDNDCH